MGDFYDNRLRTTANSEDFILSEEQLVCFPNELYIGKLLGQNIEIPALIDLKQNPAIAFLYNSNETRKIVNTCIERLVWRISCSLPVYQFEFVLFNGGLPGEMFVTHSFINERLFANDKVYYGGNVKKFAEVIDSLYKSILVRTSAVKESNFNTMVELNNSLGKECKFKYEFVVISDFPEGIDLETATKLEQIIKAGSKVGIFVIMSWNMNARFDNFGFSSSKIDPEKLLKSMMLLFPSNGRYCFRNSGHDEIYNRFLLKLDDAPIKTNDAKYWASYLDEQIAKVVKVSSDGGLKKYFNDLSNSEYEPLISEMSVNIGVDKSTNETVTLRFNSKDYIHAFILGQSGSGKSVLLNNIITSAILKYSPEDLVLYLMDFKGVEFNRYRGEKHTKAVLVDNSDPQMTLEVLRELGEENKKRVKLWQKEGVTNIDAYNKRHPETRIPMIIFVADECQVMFQNARFNGIQRAIHLEINDILNTIGTQGRSQGIHLLLATQQLDETDISGQILKNLTECILLMCSPSDSNRLVPDSSDCTEKQSVGSACYYHKKNLENQVKTYYEDEDVVMDAISSARDKSSSSKGNGGAYFCGSDMFSVSEKEINILNNTDNKYPMAAVGRNIGLKASPTLIKLKDDFSENVLFFGANKDEQTIGVLLNAVATLMLSSKACGKNYDFLIIDCLDKKNGRYRQIIEEWSKNGCCHIIDRQRSGKTFNAMAKDIREKHATPTVLVIIGSERFVEMKRNMPLDESNDNFEATGGIEPLGFDMFMRNDKKKHTFQSAFKYILDEGPMQDIHVLLQVDKPGNILFEGDYSLNATDKFNHKIILKSENKFLQPMRFSNDIDVECLSDDEEHLRAYYYQEGDDPVVFTPFQHPDKDLII